MVFLLVTRNQDKRQVPRSRKIVVGRVGGRMGGRVGGRVGVERSGPFCFQSPMLPKPCFSFT